MKIKYALIPIVLAGVAIVLAGCGLSSYTQTIILDPIDYRQDITLDVQNDVGDIIVHTHTGDSIHIKATVRGRAENDLQAKEVTEAVNITADYSYSSNTLKVDYQKERLHFDHRLSVDYSISLPREYNARLQTGTGDIALEDMEGNLMAETSTGKLDIYRFKGSINSYTRTGSTLISSLKTDSKINIETGTGTIEIGNLTLLGTQNEHLIKTGTGSIDLYLKTRDEDGNPLSYQVEATAGTGNIIKNGMNEGNSDYFSTGIGDSDWLSLLKIRSGTGNIMLEVED